MRYIILLSLGLSCSLSWAQCYVTICQTCGHNDITVFYKDGNEGAAGDKINDSCTIYTIPMTEPCRLAIVNDSTKWIETLWIDPRYGKSRYVNINNCTHQMIKHERTFFDVDDSIYMQIQKDYVGGKISSEDSFIYYMSLHEEKYINAYPDSFLAAYYLNSLISHIDIDKAIKYRNMVAKSNSQYSVFKSIDSYIENYKYKSIPNLGDAFFEFQAIQSNGKLFDSRCISDKVIVLFFWYSGCGPCHRVIPSLREIYSKYESRGLEVISFSFDKREEDWKKATVTYQLPGINVSDLTGFSSKLFLHYAVSAFPFFVVFDRNKKISMVTFGDEVPLVESKVKELLDIK